MTKRRRYRTRAMIEAENRRLVEELIELRRHESHAAAECVQLRTDIRALLSALASLDGWRRAKAAEGKFLSQQVRDAIARGKVNVT